MLSLKNRFSMQLRILSLVLAVFFTLETALSAAPLPAAGVPASKSAQILENLRIPDEIGLIEETYTPASDLPFIVHVRDAHAQPEAQRHIEAILNYLAEKGTVRTVAAEAAFGKIDPAVLRLLPDEKANRAMAEDLAEAGEINGVELFAMNNPRGIKLQGVEDARLYRDSIEIFRRLKLSKNEIRESLKAYQTALETLESSLNPELKNYLIRKRNWEQNREVSMDYFTMIRDLAKSELGLDLSEAGLQFKWPQMVRLMKTAEMEASIDTEKASTQAAKLAEVMEKAGDSGNFSSVLRSLVSKESRGSVKNLRRFFEGLWRECRVKNISLLQYPELLSFGGVLVLREEIDAQTLFSEIEKLEKQLEDRIIRTRSEQEISALGKDLVIISNLLSLELRRDEYRSFLGRRSELNGEAFRARFEKFSIKDLPLIPENLMNDAAAFYVYSVKRDEALIANTLKAAGKNPAVLVAGGFHSEGLLALLKAREIPYVSILPRMNAIADESLYEKAMIESDASDPVSLAANTLGIQFLMQPANVYQNIPGSPKQAARIVRALLTSGVKALRAEGRGSMEIYQIVQNAIAGNPAIFGDSRIVLREQVPVQLSTGKKAVDVLYLNIPSLKYKQEIALSGNRFAEVRPIVRFVEEAPAAVTARSESRITRKGWLLLAVLAVGLAGITIRFLPEIRTFFARKQGQVFQPHFKVNVPDKYFPNYDRPRVYTEDDINELSELVILRIEERTHEKFDVTNAVHMTALAEFFQLTSRIKGENGVSPLFEPGDILWWIGHAREKNLQPQQIAEAFFWRWQVREVVWYYNSSVRDQGEVSAFAEQAKTEKSLTRAIHTHYYRGRHNKPYPSSMGPMRSELRISKRKILIGVSLALLLTTTALLLSGVFNAPKKQDAPPVIRKEIPKGPAKPPIPNQTIDSLVERLKQPGLRERYKTVLTIGELLRENELEDAPYAKLIEALVGALDKSEVNKQALLKRPEGDVDFKNLFQPEEELQNQILATLQSQMPRARRLVTDLAQKPGLQNFTVILLERALAEKRSELRLLRRAVFAAFTAAVMTMLAFFSSAEAQPKKKEAAVPVLTGVSGFGIETPAGRGGAILHVTNLNDSGAGSLRAAVAQKGPRTVVFDIAGTIELKSHIDIREPFITIAGQTAPAADAVKGKTGPTSGITLKNGGFIVRTNDVLIQHLQIRVGDGKSDIPADQRDAISIIGAKDPRAPKGVTGANRVVIDHVSMSWWIDDISIQYGAQNVTFYYNIFADALNDSIHPKGKHSKGILVSDDSGNIVFIGNVFANLYDRNPGFLKRGAKVAYVNNVIYNGGRSRFVDIGAKDQPGPAEVTVVGNVFARGPDSQKKVAMIGLSADAAEGTKVHYADNILDGVPAEWLNESKLQDKDVIVGTAPVWPEGLKALPGKATEAAVLKTAGAFYWRRSEVDTQVIEGVSKRTGRIIDTPGKFEPAREVKKVFVEPAMPNKAGVDGYTNLEKALQKLGEGKARSDARVVEVKDNGQGGVVIDINWYGRQVHIEAKNIYRLIEQFNLNFSRPYLAILPVWDRGEKESEEIEFRGNMGRVFYARFNVDSLQEALTQLFSKSRSELRRAVSEVKAGRKVDGAFSPFIQMRSKKDWGALDFSGAKELADFSAAMGQRITQDLPDTISSANHSRYSVASSRLKNIEHVSVESLIEELKAGGVDVSRIESFISDNADRIAALRDAPKANHDATIALVTEAMRLVWDAFRNNNPDNALKEEFEAFKTQNKSWLTDHLLYMELKKKNLARDGYKGWDWRTWEQSLRDREPAAMAAAKEEFADEIAFQEFVQFIYAYQRQEYRDYAASKGVAIMVDIPFALDGADIWLNPEVFGLKKENNYERLSSQGVPPESAYPAGQYWQFFPYDWSSPAAWKFVLDLFAYNQGLADYVRLDHVLGYYRTYHFTEKDLPINHFAISDIIRKAKAGEISEDEAVRRASELLKKGVLRLKGIKTRLPDDAVNLAFDDTGAMTPDSMMLITRFVPDEEQGRDLPAGSKWRREYSVELKRRVDFIRITPNEAAQDQGFLKEYLFPKTGEGPQLNDGLRLGYFKLAPGEAIMSKYLEAAQEKGTVLIWETLGLVPPAIQASVERLGGTNYAPGIWGLEKTDTYHPGRIIPNSLSTFGLHDSSSLKDRWEKELNFKKRLAVLNEFAANSWWRWFAWPVRVVVAYLGKLTPRIHRQLLERVYKSKAYMAVVNWVDILGLSDDFRLNIPGNQQAQWITRLPLDVTVEDLKAAALGQPSTKRAEDAVKLLRGLKTVRYAEEEAIDPEKVKILRVDPDVNSGNIQIRETGQPILIDAYVQGSPEKVELIVIHPMRGAITLPVEAETIMPGVTRYRGRMAFNEPARLRYFVRVQEAGFVDSTESAAGDIAIVVPGADLNPLSPGYELASISSARSEVRTGNTLKGVRDAAAGFGLFTAAAGIGLLFGVFAPAAIWFLIAGGVLFTVAAIAQVKLWMDAVRVSTLKNKYLRASGYISRNAQQIVEADGADEFSPVFVSIDWNRIPEDFLGQLESKMRNGEVFTLGFVRSNDGYVLYRDREVNRPRDEYDVRAYQEPPVRAGKFTIYAARSEARNLDWARMQELLAKPMAFPDFWGFTGNTLADNYALDFDGFDPGTVNPEKFVLRLKIKRETDPGQISAMSTFALLIAVMFGGIVNQELDGEYSHSIYNFSLRDDHPEDAFEKGVVELTFKRRSYTDTLPGTDSISGPEAAALKSAESAIQTSQGRDFSFGFADVAADRYGRVSEFFREDSPVRALFESGSVLIPMPLEKRDYASLNLSAGPLSAGVNFPAQKQPLSGIVFVDLDDDQRMQPVRTFGPEEYVPNGFPAWPLPNGMLAVNIHFSEAEILDAVRNLTGRSELRAQVKGHSQAELEEINRALSNRAGQIISLTWADSRGVYVKTGTLKKSALTSSGAGGYLRLSFEDGDVIVFTLNGTQVVEQMFDASSDRFFNRYPRLVERFVTESLRLADADLALYESKKGNPVYKSTLTFLAQILRGKAERLQSGDFNAQDIQEIFIALTYFQMVEIPGQNLSFQDRIDLKSAGFRAGQAKSGYKTEELYRALTGLKEAAAAYRSEARITKLQGDGWIDAEEKGRLISGYSQNTKVNPRYHHIAGVEDIEVAAVLNEPSRQAGPVESDPRFFWAHSESALWILMWLANNKNEFLKDRGDAAMLTALDDWLTGWKQLLLRVISNEGERDNAPQFKKGILDVYAYLLNTPDELRTALGVDWFGDVLEVTNGIVSDAFEGSVSMGAFMAPNATLSLPDSAYFFRWAAAGKIDFQFSGDMVADTPANVQRLAAAKGLTPDQLKLGLMIRSRHYGVLEALIKSGLKIPDADKARFEEILGMPDEAAQKKAKAAFFETFEKEAKKKGYLEWGNLTLIADGDMMPVFAAMTGYKGMHAVIASGGPNEVLLGAMIAKIFGGSFKGVLVPAEALKEGAKDADLSTAKWSANERKRLLEHNLFPVDVTADEKAAVLRRVAEDSHALNKNLTEEQRYANHVWTQETAVQGNDGVFYAASAKMAPVGNPWVEAMKGIQYDPATGNVYSYQIRAGLSGDVRVFKVTFKTVIPDFKNRIDEILRLEYDGRTLRDGDIAAKENEQLYDLYYNLGRALFRFRQYDEAFKAFEDAKRYNGGNNAQIDAVIAHHKGLLALVKEKENPNEKALAFFIQASAADHLDRDGSAGSRILAQLLMKFLAEKIEKELKKEFKVGAYDQAVALLERRTTFDAETKEENDEILGRLEKLKGKAAVEAASLVSTESSFDAQTPIFETLQGGLSPAAVIRSVLLLKGRKALEATQITVDGIVFAPDAKGEFDLSKWPAEKKIEKGTRVFAGFTERARSEVRNQLDDAEATARKVVVGGNWKMSLGTQAAANGLVKEIGEKLLNKDLKDVTVMIAPSLPHLSGVREIRDNMDPLLRKHFRIGAQDVSDFISGAYTGEVSSESLADAGVSFIIVGHSERRYMRQENNAIINRKLLRALNDGFTAVLGIGEGFPEKDAGRSEEFLKKQVLESLAGVTAAQMENIILLYEPVWSIGTGRVVTPEGIDKTMRFIRSVLLEAYGFEVAAKALLLYGGAVKPENVNGFIGQPNVDGVLVGSASLQPESFAQIVGAFAANRSEVRTSFAFSFNQLKKEDGWVSSEKDGTLEKKLVMAEGVLTLTLEASGNYTMKILNRAGAASETVELRWMEPSQNTKGVLRYVWTFGSVTQMANLLLDFDPFRYFYFMDSAKTVDNDIVAGVARHAIFHAVIDADVFGKLKNIIRDDYPGEGFNFQNFSLSMPFSWRITDAAGSLTENTEAFRSKAGTPSNPFDASVANRILASAVYAQLAPRSHRVSFWDTTTQELRIRFRTGEPVMEQDVVIKGNTITIGSPEVGVVDKFVDSRTKKTETVLRAGEGLAAFVKRAFEEFRFANPHVNRSEVRALNELKIEIPKAETPAELLKRMNIPELAAADVPAAVAFLKERHVVATIQYDGGLPIDLDLAEDFTKGWKIGGDRQAILTVRYFQNTEDAELFRQAVIELSQTIVYVLEKEFTEEEVKPYKFARVPTDENPVTAKELAKLLENVNIDLVYKNEDPALDVRAGWYFQISRKFDDMLYGMVETGPYTGELPETPAERAKQTDLLLAYEVLALRNVFEETEAGDVGAEILKLFRTATSRSELRTTAPETRGVVVNNFHTYQILQAEIRDLGTRLKSVILFGEPLDMDKVNVQGLLKAITSGEKNPDGSPKIRYSFRQDNPDDPVHSTETLWIDRASGEGAAAWTEAFAALERGQYDEAARIFTLHRHLFTDKQILLFAQEFNTVNDYNGPVAIVGKLGGTSMAFEGAIAGGLTGFRASEKTVLRKDKKDSKKDVIDRIVNTLSRVIDFYGAERIPYVYFTAPGFFNPDGTLSDDQQNIPSLKKGFSFEKEVGRALAKKYPRPGLGPIPVTVVHDGTGGALGETSVFGGQPGAQDLFYIIAGTGVGTRRILNGKPFLGDERVNYLHNEGPHHLVFNGDVKNPDYTYVGLKTAGHHPDFTNPYIPDSRPRKKNPLFGKEDMEDRTSGPGIARYAVSLLSNKGKGSIEAGLQADAEAVRAAVNGDLDKIDTALLGKLANDGNKFAIKVVTERAYELGVGTAVFLLQSSKTWKEFTLPKHIVIGSGVARIGKIFIDAVRKGAAARFAQAGVTYDVQNIQLSGIADDTAREFFGGLPSPERLAQHTELMNNAARSELRFAETTAPEDIFPAVLETPEVLTRAANRIAARLKLDGNRDLPAVLAVAQTVTFRIFASGDYGIPGFVPYVQSAYGWDGASALTLSEAFKSAGAAVQSGRVSNTTEQRTPRTVVLLGETSMSPEDMDLPLGSKVVVIAEAGKEALLWSRYSKIKIPGVQIELRKVVNVLAYAEVKKAFSENPNSIPVLILPAGTPDEVLSAYQNTASRKGLAVREPKSADARRAMGWVIRLEPDKLRLQVPDGLSFRFSSDALSPTSVEPGAEDRFAKVMLAAMTRQRIATAA